MPPEVGRPQCAAVAPRGVRNAVKNGPFLVGLVLAVLLIVLCSVPWIHEALKEELQVCPWAHLTFEAALNLLWLLLAVGVFACWASPQRRNRRGSLPGLVSLIFIFALLFPVISVSDDLAEFELINDAGTAQAVATNLKSFKQTPAATGQLILPVLLKYQSVFFLPIACGFVSAGSPVATVTTPGDTTGNHSPPTSELT